MSSIMQKHIKGTFELSLERLVGPRRDVMHVCPPPALVILLSLSSAGSSRSKREGKSSRIEASEASQVADHLSRRLVATAAAWVSVFPVAVLESCDVYEVARSLSLTSVASRGGFKLGSSWFDSALSAMAMNSSNIGFIERLRAACQSAASHPSARWPGRLVGRSCSSGHKFIEHRQQFQPARPSKQPVACLLAGLRSNEG